MGRETSINKDTEAGKQDPYWRSEASPAFVGTCSAVVGWARQVTQEQAIGGLKCQVTHFIFKSQICGRLFLRLLGSCMLARANSGLLFPTLHSVASRW